MDGCFARDVVGGNKSIMNFMVMMFEVGLASRMKARKDIALVVDGL
jgi:hypothetical protein